MAQQVSTKVPFTLDVVNKCLCPGCPVQVGSNCVARLKRALNYRVGRFGVLNSARERHPLKHQEIPGAYCGAGKATCADINPSQNCLCGGCSVFSRYNLANGKPVGYYCRDGAQQEVELKLEIR